MPHNSENPLWLPDDPRSETEDHLFGDSEDKPEQPAELSEQQISSEEQLEYVIGKLRKMFYFVNLGLINFDPDLDLSREQEYRVRRFFSIYEDHEEFLLYKLFCDISADGQNVLLDQKYINPLKEFIRTALDVIEEFQAFGPLNHFCEHFSAKYDRLITTFCAEFLLNPTHLMPQGRGDEPFEIFFNKVSQKEVWQDLANLAAALLLTRIAEHLEMTEASRNYIPAVIDELLYHRLFSKKISQIKNANNESYNQTDYEKLKSQALEWVQEMVAWFVEKLELTNFVPDFQNKSLEIVLGDLAYEIVNTSSYFSEVREVLDILEKAGIETGYSYTDMGSIRSISESKQNLLGRLAELEAAEKNLKNLHDSSE